MTEIALNATKTTGSGKKRSNRSRMIEIIDSKYNVEQLRKYAIQKKINVSKKVNGKKVFLSKATLLKKIYDFKFSK